MDDEFFVYGPAPKPKYGIHPYEYDPRIMVETSKSATTYRFNGSLHREDGPAFIGRDGTREYWRHGMKFVNHDTHERNDTAGYNRNLYKWMTGFETYAEHMASKAARK